MKSKNKKTKFLNFLKKIIGNLVNLKNLILLNQLSLFPCLKKPLRKKLIS